MAITDALTELTRIWTSIEATLDEATKREIRRELAALVHGADWDPAKILQLALAGQPVDHPVWDALARTATRKDATALIPIPVAAMQLRHVIELSAESGRSDDSEAEARIFLAPMIEVANHDQDDHELLVIPHHGSRFAPSFQLSDTGVLLEHVAEINQLLEAHDEPWGAASWWLSPHAALHGIPADLLLHAEASEVREAAHAVADIA